MPAETLRFILDGRAVSVTAEPSLPLATVLREKCGAQGVRVACARAVCGACTVLIDGVPAAACATFAYKAEGRRIDTTMAAAESGDALHTLRDAFTRQGAFQCGYCTGGFLMLARALLAAHPNPDRDTIREWLSSGVCRCTGYGGIIEAIEDAAATLRGMPA